MIYLWLNCTYTGGNCNTVLVANIYGEGTQIEETVRCFYYESSETCLLSLENPHNCFVFVFFVLLAAFNSSLCHQNEMCEDKAINQ